MPEQMKVRDMERRSYGKKVLSHDIRAVAVYSRTNTELSVIGRSRHALIFDLFFHMLSGRRLRHTCNPRDFPSLRARSTC